MEPTVVTLEGRAIALAIRRHARARRISLRLSPARDGIILTLPRRASVASGIEFFRKKARWVLENVEPETATAFAEGAVIAILGQAVTIRHRPGRGVSRLVNGDGPPELHIHGDPAFLSRRVRDFLKKYLQEKCRPYAEAMAARIGKTVREVKIRDTRSRWGSCSAKGVLTFHWRLVLAPAEILDYLVAHEVAHLVEMNHSRRFWAVVAELYPDYVRARRRLKREGHRLYRHG